MRRLQSPIVEEMFRLSATRASHSEALQHNSILSKVRLMQFVFFRYFSLILFLSAGAHCGEAMTFERINTTD